MKIKCLPGNKINHFGTIPVSMLLSVTQSGKAGARPNTWLRAEPNITRRLLFPSAVVYICLGLSQLLCRALLQRFIISSNLWFNLINSVQLYSAKSQQHCSQDTLSSQPLQLSQDTIHLTAPRIHHAAITAVKRAGFWESDEYTSGERLKCICDDRRDTLIKSEAWCRWSQTVDRLKLISFKNINKVNMEFMRNAQCLFPLRALAARLRIFSWLVLCSIVLFCFCFYMYGFNFLLISFPFLYCWDSSGGPRWRSSVHIICFL